jgi:FkbM family methyltransferase
MRAIVQTKTALKEAFPSLWLRWHLMHRPASAEIELSFLDRIVRRDAVTVDVGANCGLYTRALAGLSRTVHAFEPSPRMAALLRRTSAANVQVHEIALSDRAGEAELLIPQGETGSVHSLASLEPQLARAVPVCAVQPVSVARLDAVVRDDVAFVKIDVEGHELNVLNGAVGLIERSRPVFLVEAEDRHRADATSSVFGFFQRRGYEGFFLDDGDVLAVDRFDAALFQDPAALLPDGGRRKASAYINNFFFFPPGTDGRAMLGQ